MINPVTTIRDQATPRTRPAIPVHWRYGDFVDDAVVGNRLSQLHLQILPGQGIEGRVTLVKTTKHLALIAAYGIQQPYQLALASRNRLFHDYTGILLQALNSQRHVGMVIAGDQKYLVLLVWSCFGGCIPAILYCSVQWDLERINFMNAAEWPYPKSTVLFLWRLAGRAIRTRLCTILRPRLLGRLTAFAQSAPARLSNAWSRSLSHAGWERPIPEWGVQPRTDCHHRLASVESSGSV